MDAIFSPEPLLDFCMHYMRDYRASPHFHRFLLFYLVLVGVTDRAYFEWLICTYGLKDLLLPKANDTTT